MYGLTECKRVSYLPPDQLDRRPDSVGIPIPNEEVFIVNEHGQEVGPGEVGELVVRDRQVLSFEEKPQISSGIINGGFMVFNKELLSHLSPDKGCDFEFGVLEDLARKGEVMVYEHKGFWECVDTERDLNHLNKLWNREKAAWKLW